MTAYKTFNKLINWPSRLWLPNTPTTSLQRGKTPNECPGYNTKQSDGKASVMLELWGMRSNFSLPSLPGPLCGSNKTKLYLR